MESISIWKQHWDKAPALFVFIFWRICLAWRLFISLEVPWGAAGGGGGLAPAVDFPDFPGRALTAARLPQCLGEREDFHQLNHIRLSPRRLPPPQLPSAPASAPARLHTAPSLHAQRFSNSFFCKGGSAEGKEFFFQISQHIHFEGGSAWGRKEKNKTLQSPHSGKVGRTPNGEPCLASRNFCFVSFLPRSFSFLLSPPSSLPSLPLSPLWSPVFLPSLHPLLLKFSNKLHSTMCSVGATMQRNSRKRSSCLPPFFLPSPSHALCPRTTADSPVGALPPVPHARSFVHDVASVADTGRGFCLLFRERCPVCALCTAPHLLISLTSESWASLQVNR